jgi:hypothetical protein
VDEKAKTWVDEAESKTLGVGLTEMEPEGEMQRIVEVNVLVRGIEALMKARMEAFRRAGRGERACVLLVSVCRNVEETGDTYERGREGVFLLGGVDDLEGQLD